MTSTRCSAADRKLKYFDPDVVAVYESQMRASAAGWTPEDYTRARAVMPKVLAFARMLHEAGVPMMIGTDGGRRHHDSTAKWSCTAKRGFRFGMCCAWRRPDCGRHHEDG